MPAQPGSLSSVSQAVLQSTVRRSPATEIVVHRPGQLRLRISGEAAAPRAETIAKARIACGRTMINGIVLDDPSLSATHFSLELTQDGVRLADRGSTNGTWFCGGRVSEMWLSAGTTFSAGAYRFDILGTVPVEVPCSPRASPTGCTARAPPCARCSLGPRGWLRGRCMPHHGGHTFVVLGREWLTRNLAEETVSKRLMADAQGNISKAAEKSDLSRKGLWHQLKRHGLYEAPAGDGTGES